MCRYQYRCHIGFKTSVADPHHFILGSWIRNRTRMKAEVSSASASKSKARSTSASNPNFRSSGLAKWSHGGSRWRRRGSKLRRGGSQWSRGWPEVQYRWLQICIALTSSRILIRIRVKSRINHIKIKNGSGLYQIMRIRSTVGESPTVLRMETHPDIFCHYVGIQ
jgi:hypothetical protein